jgi:ubiquitin carboxyl-terminal hydrolase L3
MAEAAKPRWLPLESNPEVMNKFVKNMGLSGDYEFTDIFGMDPELLAMVPQPVAGVLLLFPIADNYSEFNAQQCEEAREKGQVVSNNVYFMKQTISNACGTIGLLHCLGNNQGVVKFGEKTCPCLLNLPLH